MSNYGFKGSNITFPSVVKEERNKSYPLYDLPALKSKGNVAKRLPPDDLSGAKKEAMAEINSFRFLILGLPDY